MRTNQPNRHFRCSADSRKLLPLEHIYDAVAADAGLKQDHSGRSILHFSDNCGISAVFVLPHCSDKRFSHSAVNNRDKAPLIRYVKGIKTEETAGALHSGRDRQRPLPDVHAQS